MTHSNLDKKNQKLGYKIPENYFEEVEQKLKAHTKSVRVVPLFSRKKIVAALALAASVVVLLGVLFVNTTQVNLDANYADLDYLFEEETNQEEEEFTLLDLYVLDEEKLEINDVYQKVMLQD